MTILKISDEEYHADPGDQPTLSASIAKLLIECPSKAWLAHPRLGGQPRTRTRAMDEGALLDVMLTGNRAEIAVIESTEDSKGNVIEFPTTRAHKATKEQIAKLERNGFTPCLQREFEAAESAALAIQAKAESMGIALGPERQMALTWTEAADDGTLVECRCKMDFFDPRTGLIQDLKRLSSVSPKACRSKFHTFGYELQGAAYLSAVRQNFPAVIGREKFQLICAEGIAPYPLTPVALTGQMLELGRMKWRRAVNTWARLMKEKPNGDWPDYVDREITLEPNAFEFAEEELKAEGEFSYDQAI